ncbi:MAG: carbohydrate-binding domain-containing protein [Bacilli bacterium]|nr:carbohydrate-binding domain-containing protein [Bacilli bacterium]
MKKLFILSCLIIPLFLSGCNSNSSSSIENLSSINEFSLDYESFKASYGAASLKCGDNVITSNNGVYYINVTENKQTYELSGYFEGRIVIQNGNQLSSYKGISLVMNNAFIVNDDAATIDYTLDSKSFEIVSTSNTTNYVVNKSATNYDGHSIYSMNNLGFTLEENSMLNIYSVHGHTIKADGDVEVGGSGNAYLSSGHDGIHCHDFLAVYDGNLYSGNFTIDKAISQGIEASKSSGNGEIHIYGGAFTINNAESAMKVDVSITFTGGSLNGTGIWATPFVRATDNQIQLIVGDGISVVINGTSYNSQTF